MTGKVKVKKIAKIVETETVLNVEKLLVNDNNYVLKYIDEILNEEKRKKRINEILNYLNDCLLERDADNTGPKLIEMLEKRLNQIEDSAKAYKIEDLIWWKGTEAQLEFLFSKLVNENLIESSQFNLRFALLAKHFKNPEGNRYKNKQLSQAVRNLHGQKAPESDKIDVIIKETGRSK